MILYLDTETTGLTPGQICQLSYVMQSKEKVKAKNFYFLVDYVEPSAQMVHNLSVEKLKVLSNGKRFIDHLEEIVTDFNNASLIVAHNIIFDFSFLSKEFEKCNLPFNYQNVYCSMKSTLPICKLKRKNSAGYKYPKLSELCAHFFISDSEIKYNMQKLFCERSDFHDARFDTTALYLAVNCGMVEEESMKGLAKNL
ncbi:MAG: 3'-5' exonuclease [Clostridia bacterium]|nr:3'-5' exonuclease [Clostridia bacterium]